MPHVLSFDDERVVGPAEQANNDRRRESEADMNRAWLPKMGRMALAACLSASCSSASVFAQDSGMPQNQSAATQAAEDAPTFLSFARFKIPFNVDARESHISQVQLWVSTDSGTSWQMHGSASPQEKQFNFKAAAEGLYLFAVQTVDEAGDVFPSNVPPMRILVDTTRPEVAIRADVNSEGKLAIDVRVLEEFLDSGSATLRLRTDREAQWQEIPLSPLTQVGDVYESNAQVDVGPCREVALVLSVSDLAGNAGEATYKLDMPRTASGNRDMTLASTGNSPQATTKTGALEGVIETRRTDLWAPASGTPRTANPASSPVDLRGPTTAQLSTQPSAPPSAQPAARLAAQGVLSLEGPGNSRPEELPLPTSMHATEQVRSVEPPSSTSKLTQSETSPTTVEQSQAEDVLATSVPDVASGYSGLGRAYHCLSRAFSLDYSVDALGGSKLADVELWGTEDGGRTWQQWGSDPDRRSPFDVQVGNDGLFGFRMVIVGANGLVSNRPKDGDSADVWINVDSSVPTAKITRAVYGEGPADGTLVIDYTCQDGHLVEHPITLSYSETADGPWTQIATGLKNTGIYLWKASPNLPQKVFVRLEAVDKAGNIGSDRLDYPIDTNGLAPRGRIQGFRPILDK